MYYLKGERWQQPYHKHREKAKWGSESFVNLVDPGLKHQEENLSCSATRRTLTISRFFRVHWKTRRRKESSRKPQKREVTKEKTSMHAEQIKGGFNIAGTKGALTPTRPIQSRGRQRNRSRPGSWTGGSSQASRLITLIFLARTPHNKSKKREGKPNFVKPRAILAIFSHSCKATRYDFQFEGAPSSAKSLQSWAISCCILPLYPGAPKIFPYLFIFRYATSSTAFWGRGKLRLFLAVCCFMRPPHIYVKDAISNT